MSLWTKLTQPRAEQAHVDPNGHVVHGPTDADVRKAYERGRRDERARHTGHPIISLAVFAVALIGAGLVYLAAREGSFSGAGQVVDHKLAIASDKAQLASQDAASVVSTGGQSAQGTGAAPHEDAVAR